MRDRQRILDNLEKLYRGELERAAGRGAAGSGGVEGERAVGVPRELPAQILQRPDIDWVVAEADGSRMLPVKAPGPHEPVIPTGATLLVPVVGIDALSKPMAEIAHRPARVCAITGLSVEDTLTPAALARLITSPEGGLTSAPRETSPLSGS